MALGKCKECGTEVSTAAKICPKCGVDKPVPANPKEVMAGCLSIIGVIATAIFLLSQCSSGDGKQDSKKAAEEKCAEDDLQCLGNKGIVAAGIYCPKEIEKLAKYNVKWTDGSFEVKFSRFKWLDKKLGVITYMGDKAQFQTGFGAYQAVTYECDMLDKYVLGVHVNEGRLP